eukprot:CAMPEP_0173407758 /NCGR_PEP_ID=MMETSP1356-20130122/68013_1 /TAXON_ID=77927 ORGANISM="Hemiselmis virescens, Strain PCC157" /NCGR_SAMPLE_ID=MMETSP1356 /ASSEMBLY_ACC=CAM_ASM_000847 /LENGTH=285 /DNA_ID=CAMNT_0014368981 /DNA_START=1 /DNA_END=854 /DNA_ORIENTATION=+
MWIMMEMGDWSSRYESPAPLALILTFCVLGACLFAGLSSMTIRRFRMIALNDQLLVAESMTSSLLLSIFPEDYIPRVLSGEKLIAERYKQATVLFSDLVGFTSFASQLDPKTVVEALNLIYNVFDDITELHEVYKVETIGDGYMIASGCPIRTALHCRQAVNTALDMIAAMPFLRTELLRRVEGIRSNPEAREWANNMNIRIGLHTGELFAGVAGKRNPRFHVFGDTVNTSSRMESNGVRGKIQVSQSVVDELMTDEGITEYDIVRRGELDIKGKGRMTLYFITG